MADLINITSSEYLTGRSSQPEPFGSGAYLSDLVEDQLSQLANLGACGHGTCSMKRKLEWQVSVDLCGIWAFPCCYTVLHALESPHSQDPLLIF